MNNIKKCEKCIWFDKCANEVVCDDYCPAELNDEEVEQVAEYENDLRDRFQYYKELIEEQNS